MLRELRSLLTFMHRKIDLSPQSLTKCKAVVSKLSVSEGPAAVAATMPIITNKLKIFFIFTHNTTRPGFRKYDFFGFRMRATADCRRYVYMMLSRMRNSNGLNTDPSSERNELLEVRKRPVNCD